MCLVVSGQENNSTRLLKKVPTPDNHISKCLLPLVRYIISRFETGCISEAVEFYRGARIFTHCMPITYIYARGMNSLAGISTILASTRQA
jgi:hypothetical protein